MKMLRRTWLHCIFYNLLFFFLLLPSNAVPTFEINSEDIVSQADSYSDSHPDSNTENDRASCCFSSTEITDGFITQRVRSQVYEQIPLFTFINNMFIHVWKNIAEIDFKDNLLYSQDFFNSIFHPPKAFKA